jgi:acetyl-CoA synthetase
MASANSKAATELERRLSHLIEYYDNAECTAAFVLCDKHDPQKLAYRIVASDLTSSDLTYGELREQSERLSAGLADLGIEPGDRVATLMGKGRSYVVAVMAIWRLGAVHVPLFTAFAPPAIALRIRDSEARALICDEVQQTKVTELDHSVLNRCVVITTTAGVQTPDKALRFCDLLSSNRPGMRAAALGGSAPMVQIYTSGTTGMPKGVVVPIRALASFHAYMEFGLDVVPSDICWNAADPGWAYGLYFGVIGTLIKGAQSIMFEGGFSPQRTIEILSCYAVTNFTAAPTIYRSLRAAGVSLEKLKTLRCASSAGEPLTLDVNEWAKKALGVVVHDHYGQTETGMLINNHHHPQLQRAIKAGSIGTAMPGWSATILEPDRDQPAEPGQRGRVAIDVKRSPLAWFDGYIGDAVRSTEKFSSDGRWYFTGDTGRMDEDGYYYFSSRDDDVIIMAGYRIGPLDVESVLLTHPAVAECAVIAVPDGVRGELLVAAVVLRQGYAASEQLTQELQERVKRLYAAHAYPRHIYYPDVLPRTPSGKIQRYLIREQMRLHLSQRGSECV